MSTNIPAAGGAGPIRSQRSFVDRRLLALAAAIVLGLGASGTLVWKGSEAAFTSSTANPTNSWTSGKVQLDDNDSNGAMFSVTGLVPAATASKCITVSYTGTVASAVKMYATAKSGSVPLASDIDLIISSSPVATAVADPTCANSYTWTPVWSGTLTAFNAFTDYATSAPLSSPWTTGTTTEHRAYKIQYTLNASSNTQAATTGTTFTWEARNN